MEDLSSLNMMDVERLVEDFLKRNETGINTLHRIFFKSNNQVSLKALIASLSDELKDGCVTFLNKHSSLDELDPYLFYIVNSFCKRTAQPKVKKKTEYLCPGCLYLGKYSILSFNGVFSCEDCVEELKNNTDPKKTLFFETFFKHNKAGFYCHDCQRFIPNPLDGSSTVVCPYLDCCFTGDVSSLKKKNHPTTQSNPEKLILDAPKDNGPTLKERLISKEIDAHSKLELEEELQHKFQVLQDVIESQSNTVAYSSSEFTINHKVYVYQAFQKLLQKRQPKYPLLHGLLYFLDAEQPCVQGL